jgi:hypothetical protein
MVYKNLQIDGFLLCRKESAAVLLHYRIMRVFGCEERVALAKYATMIEDLSRITNSGEEAS